jgi:SET family sugar efflux transporter-like MFS transporter
VFATSALRSPFVTLLLAGTASGMALAYVAVWASDTFGIGPRAVAVLYVVSGLTGAVMNPLTGFVSDRTGWRKSLVVGQLAVTSVAYLAFTQAREYSDALVLVALSNLSVMGLVLAAVSDEVRRRSRDEQRNAARILAAERTAWSIGIILGPAIAAGIVSATGSVSLVFVAAALTQVAAIVVVVASPIPAGTRSGARVRSPGPASEARPVRIWSPAMVTLLAGLVLVVLPSQTRTMFLPLFVTDVLGEPAGTVGPLFTLNAFIAVMTMPHVGALAERFGAHRLLYVSAGVGATYCILQSLATSYTQSLLIQMLIGFGIALWSTSSLIFLQQLMPGRAGTAAGVYVAVQQFTPVVSGLILGPVAEYAGIPAAFAATAGLSVLALIVLIIATRLLGVGRHDQALPERM